MNKGKEQSPRMTKSSKSREKATEKDDQNDKLSGTSKHRSRKKTEEQERSVPKPKKDHEDARSNKSASSRSSSRSATRRERRRKQEKSVPKPKKGQEDARSNKSASSRSSSRSATRRERRRKQEKSVPKPKKGQEDARSNKSASSHSSSRSATRRERRRKPRKDQEDARKNKSEISPSSSRSATRRKQKPKEEDGEGSDKSDVSNQVLKTRTARKRGQKTKSRLGEKKDDSKERPKYDRKAIQNVNKSESRPTTSRKAKKEKEEESLISDNSHREQDPKGKGRQRKEKKKRRKPVTTVSRLEKVLSKESSDYVGDIEIQERRENYFTTNQENYFCYVCKERGQYFDGNIFCKRCKTEFENIVRSPATFTCDRYGKCSNPLQCSFCLPEIFFENGYKATDVPGFKYVNCGYDFPQLSVDVAVPLNEEEIEFCRYFNKSISHVLDWIWQQGDLLRLTPGDRIALLNENLGRARVMWIVTETVPRHGVIRTDNSYLSVDKFSSKLIRKTVIDISDLSRYIREFPFNSRLIYFLKLLSIFQIGSTVECSCTNDPFMKCGTTKVVFERKKEILLIADEYRQIMKEILDDHKAIHLITKLIDLMYCVNRVMSTVNGMEDVQKRFSKWMMSTPDWGVREKDLTSFSFTAYKKDRIDLCNFLNMQCVGVLNYTYDCTRDCITKRDQKVLLCDHIMSLLVLYTCWNIETASSYKPEKTADKFVRLFYTNLKEVKELLRKDILHWIGLEDLILLCMFRRSLLSNRELQDNTIDRLNEKTRSLVLCKIEESIKTKDWTNSKKTAEIQHLETLLTEIMKKVDEVASMLELSFTMLPLFVNAKAWIRDTL